MADWLSSMQQTFEYYIVNPNTWKDVSPLNNIKSCSISRDAEADTLGSASIGITESVGECYIRVYLVTIQNGVKEKHPLGTFLVQTPASSFDGRVRDVTMDAYTPLLELKESCPPIGYYIPKGADIMYRAYKLMSDVNYAKPRAPVIKPTSDEVLNLDFIADPNDTWLTFLKDLIANARFKFDLDEIGRIIFTPDQDIAALQPVWTYDDGNSSILYPDINMDHDLYGIPNVVEVVYSKGSSPVHVIVENNDLGSPVSIQNRGRRITRREVDPSIMGIGPNTEPSVAEVLIREYATRRLRELSSPEYKITYTHGYCPTRVGDCVRLNYTRAGIVGIKAKVISQNIKCEPGCPVTETAVFTAQLWR